MSSLETYLGNTQAKDMSCPRGYSEPGNTYMEYTSQRHVLLEGVMSSLETHLGNTKAKDTSCPTGV